MNSSLPRRLTCQVILALPLATLVVGLATGRVQSLVPEFGGDVDWPTDGAVPRFIAAVIWIGALAPLLLTAWRLGVRHADGTRSGAPLTLGLQMVVRTALGTYTPVAQVQSSSGSTLGAWWRAALVTVSLPLLVMWFLPPFRYSNGAIWIVGAGLIGGGMVFCNHRARAFLRRGPDVAPLRSQHQRFDVSRYEAPGRPYIRWMLALQVLLVLWGFGGAILVAMSFPAA